MISSHGGIESDENETPKMDDVKDAGDGIITKAIELRYMFFYPFFLSMKV